MALTAEPRRSGPPAGGWEAIDEVPLHARRPGTSAAGTTARATPVIRGGLTKTTAVRTNGRPAEIRRLKAASFGSVADQGARIVQRYGRFLILIAAVLAIPKAVLDLLAVNSAYDALSKDAGVFSSVTPLFDDAVGIGMLQVVITFVLGSLMAALVGAVTAEVVGRHVLSGEVRQGEVLRKVARRLPAVLGAWALSHLIWVPALLVGSGNDASLAGGVWLAVIATLFAIPLIYVVPVTMLEAVGPFAAVRRSWRLGKAVYGTSMLWMLLNGLFFVVVTVGLQLIPRMIDGLSPVGNGRWAWLANGVAGTVATVLITPIAAGATTAFYLDARVRTEGLDLVLEARRTFADVTGEAS